MLWQKYEQNNDYNYCIVGSNLALYLRGERTHSQCPVYFPCSSSLGLGKIFWLYFEIPLLLITHTVPPFQDRQPRYM